MTTFFLFRHGETDWNAQERLQGHLDIPLNERGRNQARGLIPVFKEKGIEAILSSDLSRAFETATLIAESLGVPVFQDARLREAHLGEAQGLTLEEIESKLGKELVQKWRSPFAADAEVSYPGGESGKAILERVFLSLTSFLNHSSFKKIGVATHGGVIRRVMNHILPSVQRYPIPNGVIYRIDYDSLNRTFKVIL